MCKICKTIAINRAETRGTALREPEEIWVAILFIIAYHHFRHHSTSNSSSRNFLVRTDKRDHDQRYRKLPFDDFTSKHILSGSSPDVPRDHLIFEPDPFWFVPITCGLLHWSSLRVSVCVWFCFCIGFFREQYVTWFGWLSRISSRILDTWARTLGWECYHFRPTCNPSVVSWWLLHWFRAILIWAFVFGNIF